MIKLETLKIIFIGIVLGYLWFDFKYKNALANAIDAIVKKLGITPEEIEEAKRNIKWD